MKDFLSVVYAFSLIAWVNYAFGVIPAILVIMFAAFCDRYRGDELLC